MSSPEMWWWHRLIEERIETARKSGAFDYLPGEGQPLPREAEGTGEYWAAHRLLRTNGLLPEWLQLRKDIWEERKVVRAALDEYRHAASRLDPRDPAHAALLRRLERRYVELARQINLKIDLHNLRCPSMGHELVRFPEDLIERERMHRRCNHRGPSWPMPDNPVDTTCSG
jgi:hypothetical protein